MCFTQYPLLTVQPHWSVVANSFKLIPALGTQYQLLPLPGMIFLPNFSQVSVQILLFLVGDSFSPSCLQWFLVLPHLHISVSYRSYFTAQHLSYLNFFVHKLSLPLVCTLHAMRTGPVYIVFMAVFQGMKVWLEGAHYIFDNLIPNWPWKLKSRS